MRRRPVLSLFLVAPLLVALARPARATDITDATGRIVHAPDHPAHVLPAGPPAALLIAALAPDLMLGWPMPVADAARAWLSPEAAKLGQVPRLTGKGADAAAIIAAAKPDLVIDYGNIDASYSKLATDTQAKSGVPVILLDGALEKIPAAFRLAGRALGRPERGETLARLAETILVLSAPSGPRPRVLYARGDDGLDVMAPQGPSAVFARLGWQMAQLPGEGAFRPTALENIAKLDPDIIIFASPAMREKAATDPAWRALRAVREGRAFTAPTLPFNWIEEPPSINRLLGLAWLTGLDPVTISATFAAVVWGHVPEPAQMDAIAASIRPIQLAAQPAPAGPAAPPPTSPKP